MNKGLLLIIFFLFVITGFSQTSLKKDKYYTLFDSIFIYTNYGVFNGLEYVDIYPELLRTINTNNKFFKSYTYKKGLLVYNGQVYYDLELKYELLNDLLIVPYFNEKANMLTLNPSMVEEFILFDNKFVRLNNNSDINSFFGNGFFEEKYSNDKVSLYIKYRKSKLKNINRDRVSYTFKTSIFYVVNYLNEFYKIDSKKDVINIFKMEEKAIRFFYKNNKVLLKKDKGEFYSSLLKSLKINSL